MLLELKALEAGPSGNGRGRGGRGKGLELGGLGFVRREPASEREGLSRP